MADDLTNVPEIVRKQADEALRVFNLAATAAAAAGHPVGGEAPKAEEKTALETPPVAEPTPVEPEKTPDEVAPPASLSSVANEEMTKEQRYKIMEGMQKAAGRDLSRAQAEARSLRAELEAMQARISATSAAQTSAPTPQMPQTANASELRSQVAEAFGSENVDKFFQLMRQEGFVAKQDLDEVRGEVGYVARNVAQNAQDKFHFTMEDLAPGWLQVNEDPRFIAYMNEPEGRTGIPRIEFAKQHLANNNAPLLAQYFVDFGEASGVPPIAAPAKLDKKKFAAPPSTPASGKEPEEKVEVTTVKASDMARFAREVIIGRYGGNDKAMNEKDAKTWNTYLNAQRAGRVLEDK